MARTTVAETEFGDFRIMLESDGSLVVTSSVQPGRETGLEIHTDNKWLRLSRRVAVTDAEQKLTAVLLRDQWELIEKSLRTIDLSEVDSSELLDETGSIVSSLLKR